MLDRIECAAVICDQRLGILADELANETVGVLMDNDVGSKRSGCCDLAQERFDASRRRRAPGIRHRQGLLVAAVPEVVAARLLRTRATGLHVISVARSASSSSGAGAAVARRGP